MRTRKKSNPRVMEVVRILKKASWDHDAPIWRDVAKRLEKPKRSWAEVNVGQIDNLCNDGETIIVPGKVLGAGEITKKVTVGAFSFSKSAEEKIRSSGGKAVVIEEIVKKMPNGKNIRIIG